MLYVIPEASTELGWDIGLPLLLALVLFALAVPIWVSLGFAAIGLLVMTDVLPLTLFGEALFSGMDAFALIAIPLFILTGDVLVRSGLSGKLLDIAEATLGSLRSGFGTSTVLGCGFFACISGSDAAGAAADITKHMTATSARLTPPLLVATVEPPGLLFVLGRS